MKRRRSSCALLLPAHPLSGQQKGPIVPGPQDGQPWPGSGLAREPGGGAERGQESVKGHRGRAGGGCWQAAAIWGRKLRLYQGGGERTARRLWIPLGLSRGGAAGCPTPPPLPRRPSSSWWKGRGSAAAPPTRRGQGPGTDSARRPRALARVPKASVCVCRGRSRHAGPSRS